VREAPARSPDPESFPALLDACIIHAFIHREQTSGEAMGKGDKRSFKGKVFKGSYGKTRLRKGKKKPGTATQATAKRK